jgi:FAD/FMN-containing dehydrogenase
MGGAINRADGAGTAFPHRGATYNFLITNAWADPAEDERNVRWVRETWAQIEPYLNGGVYVNYLSDTQLEGGDRVRAAYGPNYDRLVALKQQLDPENRFRHNQNIAPVTV